MPRLTHYTGSLSAVAGVLSHGFAWVPNRRNLASQLIPERDFSKREPQQFGMISFTELEPDQAIEHGKKFGNFGIMVSAGWATRNHAQRVIYVPEAGPFVEALRKLFSIGSKDLESRIEHPDDNAWQRSSENKAIANYVAGAGLWASLLTIWEYLEPESSSAQREWRIVNDSPDYSIVGATKDIIAAVSPPLNWAKLTRVLPVSPTEIEQFVCPASKVNEFRSVVPHSFEGVPIVQTDG